MAGKKQNMGELIQSFKSPGCCTEAAKRFPTGIPQLDEKTHGGLPIGLIGIPAGPSEGKTTIGLQIASNLSAEGLKGLYFSSEMIEQKMAAISVSRQSFINDPGSALTSEEVIKLCNCGEMTPELASAIEKASDACKNITLYDCNSWNHTVKEIVDEVTEYKKCHDEDFFLVVDYLQELDRTKEEQGMERKDFIDHVMVVLKELSEKLQIPVLVICAINRDTGYVGETSMCQIKDSGRLEYNYDMIIALERKCIISESEREVYLHILKQKDGEMGGKILCKYHAAYNYFEDAVLHKKMEREISPYTAELHDILDELNEWDMDPDE